MSVLTFQKNVIPLLIVEDLSVIEPLILALHKTGFQYLEIVNRTPQSMAAIKIASTQDGVKILAGTITSLKQTQQVLDYGVHGVISPGINKSIVERCQQHKTAIFPGVQTASEIMLAQELGLTVCKFFPASLSGGVPWLNAMQSPFSNIQFMPTGGINLANLQSYLDCQNVCAVGGTFLLPNMSDAKNIDWKKVEDQLQTMV